MKDRLRALILAIWKIAWSDFWITERSVNFELQLEFRGWMYSEEISFWFRRDLILSVNLYAHRGCGDTCNIVHWVGGLLYFEGPYWYLRRCRRMDGEWVTL